jgi:hypothetical protein
VAFTRSLSQQLIRQGIRVNAVAPGPIWTPLIPATMPEDSVASLGKDVPMGRPARGARALLPVPGFGRRLVHGRPGAAPQRRQRGQRLRSSQAQLAVATYPAVGVRWCRSVADRAGKGILMADDVLPARPCPNNTATAATRRPPCRASVGEGAECGFQLVGDPAALTQDPGQAEHGQEQAG